MELGDTGVSLGDVAGATKAAGALTKSLPGMAKATEGGSAEPEVCSQCNQKIVTNQPGASVAGAIASADQAANCCSNAFDCFGKGLDAVDQVQSMTG